MNRFFVTVFYSGLSPKAPGTVGTIVSIPLGLVLLYYLGVQTFALLIFALFLAGMRETDRYQAATGREDPKEVVIDELVGMWVVLAMLPDFLSWWQVLIGFGLFRLFDITKPSLIGRLDRRYKNGFGVMLDDLLAGFLAGVCTLAIFWLMGLGGALL